jgi:hypothetical protein
LHAEADRQSGLEWAAHILNPHGYTIEQVVGHRELFGYILDPDCTIDDDDWEGGIFSTKKRRLRALLANGVIQLQEDSHASESESSES